MWRSAKPVSNANSTKLSKSNTLAAGVEAGATTNAKNSHEDEATKKAKKKGKKKDNDEKLKDDTVVQPEKEKSKEKRKKRKDDRHAEAVSLPSTQQQQNQPLKSDEEMVVEGSTSRTRVSFDTDTTPSSYSTELEQQQQQQQQQIPAPPVQHGSSLNSTSRDSVGNQPNTTDSNMKVNVNTPTKAAPAETRDSAPPRTIEAWYDQRRRSLVEAVKNTMLHSLLEDHAKEESEEKSSSTDSLVVFGEHEQPRTEPIYFGMSSTIVHSCRILKGRICDW